MATAVQPHERMLEVRGLRFHYVEWGQPTSPAVVCLHGLSAMCRIWDPLAAALQDRFRVLALDQRGHGDTSWPVRPEYRTQDYVGDLEALVELWGLDRFVLIGLSMGGMNAMAYTARHKERVTQLVSVDIPPAADRSKRPNLQLDRYIADNGHPGFSELESAYTARKLTHPNTPDDVIRHHVRYLMKPQEDGRVVPKHDPRVSHYWEPADLWSDLANIDLPVLIVRGGRSQVLSERTAIRMRDAFSNAELLTIEEAGHTVPEDSPQRFIDAVEDFLVRHRA